MPARPDNDESTQESKDYEQAINEFVKKFEGTEDENESQEGSASLPTPMSTSDDRKSVDDKSMTTESLKLQMLMEANPDLVKNMLQCSSWYNAFISAEEKSGMKGDEVSCIDGSTLGSGSDPLADFTDYQLFQLQQYRITELTSQLDLVKNSVSEYHDLLDKFQDMQQENRILTHKVSLLEEQLGKKMSLEGKQKVKLEKKKQQVKLQADETRKLKEEVAMLKHTLSKIQSSNEGPVNADEEKIRILEETVVKLKMDLANSKSREDWHRLRRRDSSESQKIP